MISAYQVTMVIIEEQKVEYSNEIYDSDDTPFINIIRPTNAAFEINPHKKHMLSQQNQSHRDGKFYPQGGLNCGLIQVGQLQ